MGKVSFPTKAIIFCGVLYNDNVNLELIKVVIQRYFGKIIMESGTFNFTETNYYEDEMGKVINRVYFGTNKLIEKDRLVELKLLSNKLEKEYFTENGKRNVNIDPGYITKAKVVLATTKNFQHRIYLGKGIFAEVTLRWRRGSFSEWEWTYRDYKRKESIEFFNKLRGHYYNIMMAK